MKKAFNLLGMIVSICGAIMLLREYGQLLHLDDVIDGQRRSLSLNQQPNYAVVLDQARREMAEATAQVAAKSVEPTSPRMGSPSPPDPYPAVIQQPDFRPQVLASARPTVYDSYGEILSLANDGTSERERLVAVLAKRLSYGSTKEDENYLQQKLGTDALGKLRDCEKAADKGITMGSLRNIFSATGCPLTDSQLREVFALENMTASAGTSTGDKLQNLGLTEAQASLLLLIEQKCSAIDELDAFKAKVYAEP